MTDRYNPYKIDDEDDIVCPSIDNPTPHLPSNLFSVYAPAGTNK